MLLNKRIPVTYILNTVKYDLLYVVIVSFTVLFVTDRYRDILPELSPTIPAFVGTAISVLLSFKLSQSYDRWWEARKIWGAIVNDSRSLVIQLKSFVAKGNDEIIRRIAFRQIGWCYSLGQSLRGLNPTDNLENLVPREDLEEIMQYHNKPLALLQLHGMDFRKLRETGQMDIHSHLQLDDTIQRLCDAQGKSERIKSTVFPVTYRLFLHYVIYLFVITFSITLKDVEGYYEIPVLLLISAAFFLLEKTATHLQDPFESRPTDTPVTAIARTIEINIKQLLKEAEIPKPHPADKFSLS